MERIEKSKTATGREDLRARVVVTAAEVVSSAGIGREALLSVLKQNSCQGSSSGYSLDISLVARIRETIQEHRYFPDDRKSWLGLKAADLAWRASGLKEEQKADLGVFVGTGLSSITPAELNEDIYPHLDKGRFNRQAMAKDLSPERSAPRRHLPHHFGAFLTKKYGGKISGSNFSACAAAAQAIATGFWAIRRGEISYALVGGHDSMDHPMGLLSFSVLGALSSSYCRPFDKERDGFMLGEGAAFLVLERLDLALERGAEILAEIKGAGTSMDAWNPTAPHPEGQGAQRAMERALRDAKLSPEDIGYVNAHGTGTPLGDQAESHAISRLFGSEVPVSSIKGAIGHCIAAAGAVEAVACIGSLIDGILPGTAGLEEQDEECPVWALKDTIERQVDYIVTNSFGFGGQNCSLIIGRLGNWEI